MKFNPTLSMIFLFILVACAPAVPVPTTTPAPTVTPLPSSTPTPTPIPQIDSIVQSNTFLFPCPEKVAAAPIPVKGGSAIVLRGKFKQMGIVAEYAGQTTVCAMIPLRDVDVQADTLPELSDAIFPSVKYGNALEEITPENAQYMGEVFSLGRGAIKKIAFSPDGKFLAITTDFGVYLYDTSTYEQVNFIDTPAEFFGFSPDGKLLYTASDKYEDRKTIREWRLEDGILNFEIKLLVPTIRSFVVSPDGKNFLTSGDTGVILWKADSGRQIKKLTGDSEASLARFSHDREFVAVGLTGKVQMYEASGALKWERDIVYKNKNITSSVSTEDLIFSPDDQIITVIGAGHYAPQNSYQVADGADINKYYGSSFAYSPDGQLLARNGCSVVCISITDTEFKHVANLDDLGWPSDSNWIPATGDLLDLSFAPDGKILASASADGSVQVWEMETYSLKAIVKGFSKRVVNLDVSLDGSTIAYSESEADEMGGSGVNIILRDVWEQTSTVLPEDLYGAVFDIVYFPNDQFLATSVSAEDWTKVQGITYLWSTSTNEIAETYIRSSYTGGHISVSNDNSTMVTSVGPNANSVFVWKVNRPQEPVAQQSISLPTTDFENAISPDGGLLAFEDLIVRGTESEYKLKLYDVANKKELNAIPFPFGTGSFAFLPDSSKLVFVFTDWNAGREEIQFWDTTNWSKISGSKQDLGWNYKNIAISPDGRLLALTTWANGIKIFKISGNVSLLTTLTGHAKQINKIAFSQNGRFLVSGGEDGTIKMWAVMP